MHRTPRGLLTAGLAVVFALSSAPLFGQDQGNQRGQRGPTFGGPGGPGGWGGPGGRGGGVPIPMLLQQEAVQADLKLTDAQKEQIKDINTKAETKRNEAFRKMQAERDSQRNNNQRNNNNNNQQGNDRREGFRAMMEQMNAEREANEAALAKVLNPTQKTRIKQIALQVEGPQAFAGDNLQQKLTLEEEQVESIRGILSDLRSQQRETMAAVFGDRGGNNGGDRGNNGGDRGNNNANGGDRGNRGGDRGNRGGNNNGGDRGNNRGGNNNANGGDRGNRGGNNGGGNRPQFDFNDPANQAKMAQAGKDRLKLNDKAMVAIAKVLSPAQRSLYSKMVGTKFDVSKISMRGPGGPGGPPPANTAAATPPATTTPATDAAAKSATAARPKSLSERRAAAAAGAPK